MVIRTFKLGDWRRATFRFGILCFLAAVPLTAQTGKMSPAPSKPTEERFSTLDASRVAEVSSPKLSPDGKTVAYLVTRVMMPKDSPWKRVTHLWLVPANGPVSAARQYTRGDKSVGAIEWSPNGEMIAFEMKGRKKGEGPQVWFMYANGGEPWQVTQHKGGVRGFEFSPNGKSLLLVAPQVLSKADRLLRKEGDAVVVAGRHFRLNQLWSWDIATGQEKQLTHGKFTVSDPRYSPDGTRVTFTARRSERVGDFTRSTCWLLNLANGHLRRLVASPLYTLQARWSHDGRWIAFLGSNGVTIRFLANIGLYVVRASGGTPRKLGHGFALSAGAPVWSPDGKTIYVNANIRESVEVFSTDLGSGEMHEISRTPGEVVLDEISTSGVAFGTFSDPNHPAEIFRSDGALHMLHMITDQNHWLTRYALATVQVIHWRSNDGTRIDGILTRPVGFEPDHKYPLLLNPHGGPTGASTLGFDSTTQVLAANGYLVLQPNFRGSTGRGLKFAEAITNNWGVDDYEDCMAGVDAAIRRGWADPRRMGVFGWSFGGYESMWIDTHSHRFKAIAPGAGVSDLYSMTLVTDIPRYALAFMASTPPWEEFEHYWAQSPMKYIQKVTTPTMILQGQHDERVPLAQGIEFYRALRELHRPVEFVEYPSEHHGFVQPRHIRDRMQRYLVFFGKYLDNPPITEPETTLERMAKDLP